MNIGALNPNYLTPHFDIQELTITESRAIDNSLPDRLIPNVLVLAGGLEIVRSETGAVPIFVTSGYRCPELNESIGGARRSDHLLALAADCHHATMSVSEFFLSIYAARARIPYRQLIYEFGRWVHIAFPMDGAGQEQIRPENKVLVIRSRAEGYLPYHEGMEI